MSKLVPRGIQLPPPQENNLALIEARLNGGMNTYVDGADLPNFQCTFAENVEIKADKVRKKVGTSTITPTKPDSNPVLLYTQFKRFDGTTIFLRFTATKIYRLTGGTWTEITSASPYSITNTTRIRITTLNDRFFFTVGNKEIQEINFTANTYAALGNAKKFKYITGFFNRLIGANLYDSTTPNPTLVGYSGDLNFAQWDPLVDISAGEVPLLEAATDFTDPITGVFGFASVMLFLRERSLWTATKRPVASNPLQFQASFPYVGCDCPNSATQKRNGLVWYDRRSNQVYDYTIGSAPREIGNPIKNQIKDQVTDLEAVMGAYDPIENRYHLLVPSSRSTTAYEYVFDYGTESWVQNTREHIVSVSALDSSVPVLTIDQLTGTIDSLVGTIDSLVISAVSPPALFYGRSDGDIVKTDATLTTDSGTAYASTLVSKIYTAGRDDLQISRLSFRYLVRSEGEFKVYVSRDNGDLWELAYTETLVVGDIGNRKRATIAKNFRASEFMWKFEMTTANVEILEYGLEGIISGFTKPY